MRTRSLLAPVAAISAVGVALSGCSSETGKEKEQSPTTTIDVRLAGAQCPPSVTTAASGPVRFTVTNAGTEASEFEVLSEDKSRVVAEKENIAPGTSADLTVVLEPGRYVTGCKPGMIGAVVGLTAFTVTESGKAAPSAEEATRHAEAANTYISYLRQRVTALVAGTTDFASAFAAGDTEKARHLYPRVRMDFERIEPTAESFGDLDPALDLREADAQAEGGKWTGWHVAEKDLWRPQGYVGLSPDERKSIADGLVVDTRKLNDLVHAPSFSIELHDITNGAIALLEEIASTKVTGEEETFSHTDLYDIQANLEGSKTAFDAVRDLAKEKDAEAVEEIDSRFTAVQKQLDRHREGADGFVSFDRVSGSDRKQLSDSVNALRRPLSTLTEIVVG